MKENKGVTLIALVITIVVLLILAGVTLNVVLDPANIIGKAEEAKVKTNRAVAKEELQTVLTLAMLENEGYNLTNAEIVEKLEDLGATCTENGNEYDIEYRENNFILTEEGSIKDVVTSTIIEVDASYIGEYVNYGGQETYKGVKWRIFNAENGQIQLIADNYIKSDVMPTATNIKKGTADNLRSDYCVSASDNRITLLNYINTTSNWNDFVAISGTTVTGGPTLEQFKNSYNRTHGASSEATVKEIFIAKSAAMSDELEGYYIGTSKNPTTTEISGLNTTEMENLYVIDELTNSFAYCFGSPSAYNNNVCVMIVDAEGYVSPCKYDNGSFGLRPLATLPTGTKLVEQANGTYSIKP